jgi:broad specificity phosphatase PhoE
MPARITFISHGVTDAIRRASFPADESLEEREAGRLAALRWSAPRAQTILAAPEQRTQQTAQALGLAAARCDALRDCNYGSWTGRQLAHIEEEDPVGLITWLTDPSADPHGGESVAMLVDRVGRWLDEQASAEHTVAVTHPSVIRSAIVYAFGAPIASFWRVDISPLTLTDLRFNGRFWTVRSMSTRLGGEE